MPELPEVETVRNVLKGWVIGKTIKNVDVFYERVIENMSFNEFKNKIINQKINDIGRMGKYLLFVDGDDYIAPKYIEDLVCEAESKKADICFCGYTCVEPKQTYLHHDYVFSGTIDKDAVLRKLFAATGGTVCGKLYRLYSCGELFKKISLEPELIRRKDDICEKFICYVTRILTPCGYGNGKRGLPRRSRPTAPPPVFARNTTASYSVITRRCSMSGSRSTSPRSLIRFVSW